jgi:tetratricopeptide (TPR) repeat protein
MTNNNYYIYINTLIIKTKGLLTVLFLFVSPLTFSQNQNEIQLANEYLLKGEKNKALEIYRELSKSERNISFIHNNYLNTMLDLSQTAEAQAYLKKLLRRDPENVQYQLDVGIVYVRSGELPKADRYFRDLVNEQ